jgi:hypothetical protein
VIYDEIKKRHENFVIDHKVFCSGISLEENYYEKLHPVKSTAQDLEGLLLAVMFR